MSREFVCSDCKRHRIISIGDELTWHCPYCRLVQREEDIKQLNLLIDGLNEARAEFPTPWLEKKP